MAGLRVIGGWVVHGRVAHGRVGLGRTGRQQVDLARRQPLPFALWRLEKTVLKFYLEAPKLKFEFITSKEHNPRLTSG